MNFAPFTPTTKCMHVVVYLVLCPQNILFKLYYICQEMEIFILFFVLFIVYQFIIR